LLTFAVLRLCDYLMGTQNECSLHRGGINFIYSAGLPGAGIIETGVGLNECFRRDANCLLW